MHMDRNNENNLLSFTSKDPGSVADPDPQDPYAFGPSGSGYISQRYTDPDPAQDPGCFYHQAKIVRKTLIPTVL